MRDKEIKELKREVERLQKKYCCAKELSFFSNIGTNGLSTLPVPGLPNKLYIDIDTGEAFIANPTGLAPYYISPSWNKSGNSGTNPSTDFIGTTDSQPLVFRTNNIESARIFSATRNWRIGGTTDDGYKLDVSGGRTRVADGLAIEESYYGLYLGNGVSLNKSDHLRIYKNWSIAIYQNPNAGHYFQIAGITTLRLGDALGTSNKNVYLNEVSGNTSIGTATNGGRLYVRAQGALSTDNVFRIRNSADNADILNITGDGAATFSTDIIANGIRIGKGNSNITGNVICGVSTLQNNTTGYFNTGVGYNSLASNTTGNTNTAIGTFALKSNTIGTINIAIGYDALGNNVSGHYNIAIGQQVLLNCIGNYNLAIGTSAGGTLTTGASNLFVGWGAGSGITTGNYNTIIGQTIGALPTTLSNHTILSDGSGNMRFVSFNDGNVYIGAGTTLPSNSGFKLDVNGTSRVQKINISAIPTSSSGLVAGDVWNDAGTLKIV